MLFEIHDVAFGACNNLNKGGKTSLAIRILDPQKSADRQRLEQLLETRPDTHRELAVRQLTFGRPGEVELLLAPGPQRGFVKGFDKLYEEEDPDRVPIDVLGIVARRVTQRILEKHDFKLMREPVHVYLKPGEVQQYFVRLQRQGAKQSSAFALQIDHTLEPEQGRPIYIGGLSYLLFAPHDPFRAAAPRSYPPPPKADAR